jgi:anti-sigma factor RsiW
MNCKGMEKTLVAYLDGRAHPRERRDVQTHLAACPSCRARAEEFRLLWGALDELPVLSPSPGFDAAVRMRVAQEPRRAGLWSWLMMPSPRLTIGATALLVFSVWLSSLPRASQPVADAVRGIESEFRVIENLPVLEDYDVLANFEALSELPVQPVVQQQPVQ